MRSRLVPVPLRRNRLVLRKANREWAADGAVVLDPGGGESRHGRQRRRRGGLLGETATMRGYRSTCAPVWSFSPEARSAPRAPADLARRSFPVGSVPGPGEAVGPGPSRPWAPGRSGAGDCSRRPRSNRQKTYVKSANLRQSCLRTSVSREPPDLTRPASRTGRASR